MSASLYLSSIANAIESMSISGVTVLDRDNIPVSMQGKPNILFPKPGGWITDFSIEYDSVLQGTNAPMHISYTLNYRFLGVKENDAFTASYSALVDKIILIINAIIANPAPYSGKVGMQAGNIDIGPKDDPAGNMYFGADFALLITEQQN